MAARPLDFTLAAALVLLPAALSAAPYLVKDLNPSLPRELAEIRLRARGIGPEVSYFAASDPAHGVELWRSDGTPGGTERLTDVCAGRCDSLPPWYMPPSITVHAGRVFFAADDGFSGTELWVSDGTPGSERRVRDVCPGSCSAVPSLVEEVGERLLFVSRFPAKPARFELWRTDGTRDGTVRVKVLCTSGCTVSSALFPIGERALFLVNTRPEEAELWVTDGTAAGTRSLRELGIELTLKGHEPKVLPGDGFAWAWASDGLWRTDGTAAGTFRLKRIDELTTEPDGYHFLHREVVWHGLFIGNLSEGEMIRSDGTPEGTFRFASLPVDQLVEGFALLDSELLLQVEDSSHNSVLWSTRGTADTTGPRLEMATADAVGEDVYLARLTGDRAVFMRSFHGAWKEDQLWVTDGTAAGTRQLAAPGGFALFSTGDGRAFFLRQLNLRIDNSTLTEVDLWITDGTEAGTHLVRSSRDAPGSSDPGKQAALGGKLVFSALGPSWQRPLFISDGTAAGTGRLSADIYSADSFFRFGDRLLFSTLTTTSGSSAMWATDGTPGGTAQVTDYSEFSNPALFGGQILFNGGGYSESDTGRELWKTDGRAVELVKDINRFFVDYDLIDTHLCVPEGSYPVPAGVVGGRLLLTANDGRSGRELWASDGTRAGTVLLRDINPGRSPEMPEPCYDGAFGPSRDDTGLSSDPQGFVLLGSIALFSADDGRRGRELWITNGTFLGTHRVADLVPGARGSAPHDLVRFHDRVYFLAANPGQGESLWKTDGTARGTTRVLDLTLNGLPSWGRSLTVAAGRLFFTVYNEATGAELWASTGDASGTGLVIDLNPGPGHSSSQFLTAVGRALLFTADDGLTGLEPWRTDGTAAGTVRLGDIAPGRDASSPGPFTALQNVVMTGADDGVHGREPWAVPKAEIVQSLPN